MKSPAVTSSGPIPCINGNGSAHHAQLKNAAHQFEASLMEELLAPLRNGSELFSGEDDTESKGALADFGSQALADAISKGGGFGIAREILAKLS